ncbi:hypothetical protein HD806DRAFT_152912 [Xylariaceae sp. AK1471]|nr:hypothetical protein HD806DRAFT_152912 [Xylariaceae sp. AK1471]
MHAHLHPMQEHMMSPRPTFLGLPRELRDMIYRFYVAVDKGYVYNFQSGKLRTADGRPIDHALMMTCRLVACEMRGIALTTNTITFAASASYSDQMRPTAARFDQVLRVLHTIEGKMLHSIKPWLRAVPELMRNAASDYPQFAPVAEVMLSEEPVLDDQGYSVCYWDHLERRCDYWLPSVYRQAIRRVLQNAASHDPLRFCKLAPYKKTVIDPFAVLDAGSRYPAWFIPTEDQVDDIVNIFLPPSYENRDQHRRQDVISRQYWVDNDSSKYYFSAAAAAIRFLTSLKPIVRLHVRSIILQEDRASVAIPARHAQGLIPFCRANRRLHIERRVTLLGAMVLSHQLLPAETLLEDRDMWRGHPLEARDVCTPVAIWLAETLALGPAGMPPGSFSLIIEGGDSCAELFRHVLRRDAAFQEAFDLAVCRKLVSIPHGYQALAMLNPWVEASFPQGMRSMTNADGNALIRCTFDAGEPWDIEAMIEARSNWSMRDWNRDIWCYPAHILEDDVTGLDRRTALRDQESWLAILREHVIGAEDSS